MAVPEIRDLIKMITNLDTTKKSTTYNKYYTSFFLQIVVKLCEKPKFISQLKIPTNDILI